MSLVPRISRFLCLAGAPRTAATIAVTSVVALASFAASPARAVWCGPSWDSWSCQQVPVLPSTPNYFTAIAVSESTLLWGVSSGYDSRYGAEQRALFECSKVASDCKVRMWAQGMCIALATSKTDMTWGVDKGSYPETAQAKALAQCHRYGGKACVVETHPCSQDD
jgi:hypothetical protein